MPTETESPAINIKPLYGHIEINSWFEANFSQGYGIYKGMCSKRQYDENGKLVDCKIEPTGITMYME
jgi:hypothetical protein